jgi:protein TIF31
LEIDGLHYVASAIINYRGHRIIAQSIIPGILNNSELSSLAEYGTVDEQKTIQSNEEFHSLMKKVAAKLGVQVNSINDASGKAVEIAGCVEIKGIRGTDKRCYIVDLQGMTPRDANFLGDDYHTCLIR